MQVAVIGAGSWGTTVASLATRNAEALLWARNSDVAAEIEHEHRNSAYLEGCALPERLRATDDLEYAVASADVMVMGVPSHGFREVLEKAAPFVRPWIPIVSLTKGFEQGSLHRMTEVIEEVLPGHPAGVLTGPNIAKEIIAGQAAASVIATEDLQVAEALQHIFATGLFRVYLNHDVIGCEIGGALKNVVAIAAGMAQGLEAGDNTRAMVITRGLAELTRLGVAMGGEAETFAGLAGMGDLLTTCVSRHSRNRHVGEQLGLGRSLDEIIAEMNSVAEGVRTAITVMELAERHGVEMPVCDEIRRVLHEGARPERAYAGLIRRRRRPGHERDAD